MRLPAFRPKIFTHHFTTHRTSFARLFQKHARLPLFTLSDHTVLDRLTPRKGNPKIYHGVAAAAAVTAKVFAPPTTIASQSGSLSLASAVDVSR